MGTLLIAGALGSGVTSSLAQTTVRRRAEAHGASPVLIQYDQRTNSVQTVGSQGAASAITRVDAHTYRLARPAVVQLRVVNTNTALYHLSADASTLPAANAAPLQAFLSRAKPYLPDATLFVHRGGSRGLEHQTFLPAMVPATWHEAAAAVAYGQRLEQALRTVDDATRGSHGLAWVHAQTLMTVDAMRTGDATTNAQHLRDSLGLHGAACAAPTDTSDMLRHSSAILAASTGVASVIPALEASLAAAGPPPDSTSTQLRDQLQLLRSRGDSLLRSADSLLTTAYAVERLALTVASACSEWTSPPEAVSGTGGRKLTVHIEPQPQPELARVAASTATTFSVTVLPPPPALEPSLGLSLILAPNARFPVYAARAPATGSGAEIYQQNVRDARLSYGVTLGFGWRDLSTATRSVRLWLPELTVAEGSDRAFGAGAAVSFGPVKLGIGALWARHTVLDAQHVGDHIPNAGFLRLRDTYGRASPYVSVSIFDASPLPTSKP